MRVRAATRVALLAIGIAALAAATAVAQEDPPPEPAPPPPPEEAPAPAAEAEAEQEEPAEERLRIRVEVSGWIAQGTGAELFVATQQDPTNPSNSKLLGLDGGTESAPYYEVHVVLPRNVGAIGGTYYSVSHDGLGTSTTDPGHFLFGEILAHPLFAGFANDGLADGFTSAAGTSLSDMRLDFSRTAFESSRARGRWFVGLRNVDYDRGISANYFALVPGLPPVQPPITNSELTQLIPLPDIASSSSSFEGRGIEGGLEVAFPLYRDRLQLEAEIAVAALRGQIDAAYRSQTHYWVYAPQGGTPRILHPPYAEFDDLVPSTAGPVPLALDIQQRTLSLGIQPSNIDTSNDVIEASIGVRYRFLDRLEAFIGWRNVRYSDVAADVRPAITTVIPNTGGIGIDGEDLVSVNVQGLVETKYSATYDGFFFGVATHF